MLCLSIFCWVKWNVCGCFHQGGLSVHIAVVMLWKGMFIAFCGGEPVPWAGVQNSWQYLCVSNHTAGQMTICPQYASLESISPYFQSHFISALQLLAVLCHAFLVNSQSFSASAYPTQEYTSSKCFYDHIKWKLSWCHLGMVVSPLLSLDV